MTAHPRVLALLGTDHHRFDRAVAWLDAWAAAHPDAEVMVQHGRSTAPTVAGGRPFLDHAELTALMTSSDAVVSHGGPATISEARAAGHRPVVVPRDPTLGEHVDDHQKRFTAWLATKDLIDRQTDQDGFVAALDAAVQRGRSPLVGADAANVRSVARLEQLVDEALAGGRVRDPESPVVVYIAGLGRSGSTLLERLLGESPKISCLGEVVHVWERGLAADERCACGEAFSACPHWQAIGDLAFGGWHTVDLARVRELRSAVDRQRRIPRTALPAWSRATRSALIEYAALYSAIYRAAAQVAGVPVIVDSSKHVSTAFALSHDADLDLRVVHLIRDPRAVAYSWSKQVRRPEADDGEDALMAQYSAAGSARRWLTSNLLVDGLRSRGLPVARMHYEDLVRDPDAALGRLAVSLDLPVRPEVTRVGGEVVLGPSHSVAGNPMRFVTGRLPLSLDDAWTHSLEPRHRRLVTGLTSPLYRWYGR